MAAETALIKPEQRLFYFMAMVPAKGVNGGSGTFFKAIISF